MKYLSTIIILGILILSLILCVIKQNHHENFSNCNTNDDTFNWVSPSIRDSMLKAINNTGISEPQNYSKSYNTLQNSPNIYNCNTSNYNNKTAHWVNTCNQCNNDTIRTNWCGNDYTALDQIENEYRIGEDVSTLGCNNITGNEKIIRNKLQGRNSRAGGVYIIKDNTNQPSQNSNIPYNYNTSNYNNKTAHWVSSCNQCNNDNIKTNWCGNDFTALDQIENEYRIGEDVSTLGCNSITGNEKIVRNKLKGRNSRAGGVYIIKDNTNQPSQTINISDDYNRCTQSNKSDIPTQNDHNICRKNNNQYNIANAVNIKCVADGCNNYYKDTGYIDMCNSQNPNYTCCVKGYNPVKETNPINKAIEMIRAKIAADTLLNI